MFRQKEANLNSRHFECNVELLAFFGFAANDQAKCLQVKVESQAKFGHAKNLGEATDEIGDSSLKMKCSKRQLKMKMSFYL